MGIFSRLGDIINSNINSMLDRAEDPEKIVRLIVQEMEDTLVEVRAAAARSIAEKKDILRKADQLEAAQAEWQRKAELAVEKGREDLAKGALVAKAQAATAAELLRRELETIESALAKTNEDLGRLEAKLTEAKNKQKSFTIRHDAARDQIRIRTQLHDGRIDEALSRYEHIERKIDTLEGHVEILRSRPAQEPERRVRRSRGRERRREGAAGDQGPPRPHRRLIGFVKPARRVTPGRRRKDDYVSRLLLRPGHHLPGDRGADLAGAALRHPLAIIPDAVARG